MNHASNVSLEEKRRLRKMLAFEKESYLKGFKVIAGVDEAGRGPLAGPVVAAACILPKGMSIAHINDSKQLNPKMRHELFQMITHCDHIHFGIGIIEPAEIDRINIYQATILAMRQAIINLHIPPDCVLIDGMTLEDPNFSSIKIVKGDQLSQSIAAASIIAKETRDHLMRNYHREWPCYGFDEHKGYGTPKHLNALELHGPCIIHRRSFAPVKEIVEILC